jgi:two-component system cell cycle sensor histidine kinase PleC
MLGFSEVMQSEIFGPHSAPVYKEYAGEIHNSGVHLLNLINEILDLSRIEAGRYELNEDAVSLRRVVENCHYLLKLRASNRNIKIHEIFEHDMPRLWADERAVRQICLNLLSNAVKFTPQRGEIWLKVGWTASGGQYMSVKDRGPVFRMRKFRSCLRPSVRAQTQSRPPNRAPASACRSPRASSTCMAAPSH